MEKDRIDSHQDALDHAWDWFECHADQRMSMIKFAILTIGGVGAAAGVLIENREYFLSAMTSVLGALLSFGFIQLDRRTSELIKLGENALIVEQNRIAEITGNSAVKICEAANITSGRRFQRYSEIFRMVFGTTFVGFMIFGLLDACSSAHLRSLIARLIGLAQCFF